jgi:plasmid stabilization system protein ParE
VHWHVVTSPEAERDLAEAFKWYEEKRLGLGQDFIKEVEALFRAVERNVFRHAIVYKNVRQALLRRFPYKVFYYVEADKAQVIAIIHAKRSPESWHKRI